MSRGAGTAVGFVVLAVAANWVGFHSALLTALLIVSAVGLSFDPLLPAELRRAPVARIVAAPLVGAALSSIGLITAALVRVPLTRGGVYATVIAIILGATTAAALLPPSAPVPFRPSRADWASLLALGGIMTLAAGLAARVVGVRPVPGQDWGHYVLYADQVSRHHRLLIDNPFWMGRLPFPDDPGIASLYGALLSVTGIPAADLSQGILFVSCAAVASLYVCVRVLWGEWSALVTAAVYAALPMTLDMLSWHGLANTWAFVLIPFVLLALGAMLRGQLDWRWALLLGISMAALLAAHRLSFLLTIAVVALGLALSLVLHRRRALLFALLATGIAVSVGAGVLVHVAILYSRTGGVPTSASYAAREITTWTPILRDITKPVAISALVALAVLLVHPRLRRDAAASLPLISAAVAAAAAYANVVHVPLDYQRAGYYLGIPFAIAIGVALPRLGASWLPLLAVPLVLFAARRGSDVAPQYRAFYEYATPVALRGLGLVDADDAPGHPVVTDACWSFELPWLLQRRVYSALQPWQIGVQQEERPAQLAHTILYGGGKGDRLAHRMHVEYAIVDPTCTDAHGRQLSVPTLKSRPVFVSSRLVVLKVARAS